MQRNSTSVRLVPVRLGLRIREPRAMTRMRIGRFCIAVPIQSAAQSDTQGKDYSRRATGEDRGDR